MWYVDWSKIGDEGLKILLSSEVSSQFEELVISFPSVTIGKTEISAKGLTNLATKNLNNLK